MTLTRIDQSKQLYQSLHNFYHVYLSSTTQNIKEDLSIKFPNIEVKNLLSGMEASDIVAFANFKNDKLSGLTLVFSIHSMAIDHIPEIKELISKISELPQNKFNELNLPATIFQDIPSNTCSLMYEKIIKLPANKLSNLSLDSIPLTEGRIIAGGALIQLAFYTLPYSKNYTWLKQFSNLIVNAPVYTQPAFEAALTAAIEIAHRGQQSQTCLALLLLDILNKLKIAYHLYKNEAHYDPNLKNSLVNTLKTICEELDDATSDIYYIVADFINEHIKLKGDLLSPIICALYNKVSYSQSNPKATHDQSLINYHTSQMRLVSYYLAETHTSLANRLLALEQAFCHAALAFLCRKEAASIQKTHVIYYIAENYLAVEANNLMESPRDRTLLTVDWLKVELLKICTDRFISTAYGSQIEHLITLLQMQRNLVYPLQKQLNELMLENQSLRHQITFFRRRLNNSQNTDNNASLSFLK